MKLASKFSLFGALLIAACTSAPREPAQVAASPVTQQAAGPDIWELKKMAQNSRFAELNDLFYNHGINLDRLPSGYAAGAAGKVLAPRLSMATVVLDNLTANIWRGKIFFPSTNPRISQGLNRIQKFNQSEKSMSEWSDYDHPTYENSIVPMASFVTKLLEPTDPTVQALVPGVKSNVVILNYAHPKTPNAYMQEQMLTRIQVYDVMVAVPGKYGPIFIGKTWFGHYDEKDDFTTKHPENQIAWFFLDFNEEAVRVQRQEHWEPGDEKILNPLPLVNRF